MRATIERTTPIQRTGRVIQLEGMFDVPPTEASTLTWEVDLPLEDDPWHVGLIVGPSGSGKTTIARHLWPDQVARRFEWPTDRAVVDAFPPGLGVKEVVALLSSVGFSSPPAWLRPFGVLSNGEQFRATVARRLAEDDGLTVIDEFTSVVDRTVAQIGSCAIATAVRKRGRRFIAVSCHYDIEDWLQPDWTYQPHTGAFTWRSVQPRPGITLDVVRCDRSAWRLFGPHHYLSESLAPSAVCFAGLWDDHPVVFLAVLPFPHPSYRNAYRAHRLVTLPDYQGVGLGNRFCDHLAGVYHSLGRPFFVTTGHPARVGTLSRNPRWAMTRAASTTTGTGDAGVGRHMRRASSRLTSGFRYVGPAVTSPLADELRTPNDAGGRSAALRGHRVPVAHARRRAGRRAAERAAAGSHSPR